MATIYNVNAEYLTQGLQGSAVCDEAIITARRMAAERDEDVIIEDNDEFTLVHPDGTSEEVTAKEIGFE